MLGAELNRKRGGTVARKDTETTLSVTIDKEYKDKYLEPLRKAEDRNMNGLLRQAIFSYVDKSPRDDRQVKLGAIYTKLNEAGKEWLYNCALAAMGEAKFKA